MRSLPIEAPASRCRDRHRLLRCSATGVVLALVATACGGGGGDGPPERPAAGKSALLFDTEDIEATNLASFAVADDGMVYVVVELEDGFRVVAVRDKDDTDIVLGDNDDDIVPTAVATGDDGELFVAGSGKVVRIDPDGNRQTIGSTAPEDGAAPGDPGLTKVVDMTADRETGDLYLRDHTKVDRLSADGELTTMGGIRTESDGESPLEDAMRDIPVQPAQDVRFRLLTGTIAYDPTAKAIYVSNYDDLVKIEPGGQAGDITSNGETVKSVLTIYERGLGGLLVDGDSDPIIDKLAVRDFAAAREEFLSNFYDVGIASRGAEIGRAFDARGNFYEAQTRGRALDRAGDNGHVFVVGEPK